MDQFVCTLSYIPVRKEPDHRSEMTSQVLFGERVLPLEERGEWIKIKTVFDSYQGWVENFPLQAVLKEDMPLTRIIEYPFARIQNKGTTIYIPAGSEIPNPEKSNHFVLNRIRYHLLDPLSDKKPNITVLAKKFLHAPYLWGGRTVFGLDCSGFTQILYKVTGISLPRDAAEQVLQGTGIELLREAKNGDLAFFNNPEGRITHVGLLLNEKEIIHASKMVRIDRIDQKGIYNEELGRYTHTLHSIRRVQA